MRNYLTFLLFFIVASLGTTFSFGQNNNHKPSVIAPNGFKINSFTGNLFYERQDLFIESIGPDLDLNFSYNHSSSNVDMGYGFGWTFGFNMYFEKDEESIVTMRWADGSSTKYFKRNSGEYVGEKGVFDDLTPISANTYKLRTKDGTSYFFENANHKRLTKIEDRCGNMLNLSYTDTLLTTITDATNRSIHLEWAGGHVIQMSHNLLDKPIVFNYEYDQEGNLIRSTDPMGYSIDYSYDEQHRMVQLVDQNRTPTIIVYHQSGGVKSFTSCDFSYNFTYNQATMRTYVVEEVNDERLITTYQFDEENRIVEKLGNCCGYNMKYAYDDNNNVSKRIDGNENERLYVYDDKGNPLYITDEEGNQEAFTYEKFHSYISGETDKMGNETSYEYDAKGNLLMIKKPLGITESYTYDEQTGNMLGSTDGNGNIIKYEYDQHGYLTTINYPHYIIDSFKYDQVGNKISETDGNGNTTIYIYDDLNRLIETISPLGASRQFIYDGKNNILEEKDPLDNRIQKVYDGLDRVIAMTTRAGITYQYEYDARGNKTGLIDPLGQKFSYSYNFRNQLISETNILGHTKNYTYDEAGRKIGETDALGNTSTFKYNNLSQLVEESDPLGNTKKIIYDKNGRSIKEIDAQNNIVTNSYDKLGRLIQKTDPLGNTTFLEYDAIGNVIKTINPNGVINEIVYDSLNRVVKELESLNRVTSYQYDLSNNLILEINANGDSTQYKYNETNQLIEEIDPSNETIHYEYDALSRLIKIQLPSGNLIERVYDADDKVLLEKDKEGIRSQFTYNEVGLATEVLDEDGILKKYQYDKGWRISKIQYADGREETLSYDANDNVTVFTNTKGNTKKFQYDPLNRVTQEENELGYLTKYEYDEIGNQIKTIDTKGNVYQTIFDANKQITRSIYPNGTSKSYKYDPLGNIIERTEVDGTTIEFLYDTASRLKERKYPNGEIYSFDYDLLDRNISANTPNVKLSFQFDKSDRVTKEIINNNEEISYEYKIQDRELTITYPSGKIINHLLDYRNRAKTTNDSNGLVATLTYNNHRLKKINYGNNLSSDYKFDINGRIESIVTNPNKIFEFSYTYDSEDNKLYELRGDQESLSKKYTYDALNRLTSYQEGVVEFGVIQDPIREITYELDQANNRTLKKINESVSTYATNSSNQFTAINQNDQTIKPVYTKNGGLEKFAGNQFGYDADNLLIKVDDNISYIYDALSRRYEKKVGNTITRYYYHHSRVIEEQNEQGQTLASHIYAGATDFLLKTVKDNDSFYYHTNGSSSIIGITDETGNKIESYDYDPFGRVSIFDKNTNIQTSSEVGNNFYYIGQQLDAETGLYYFKARYYNADLGSFLKKDPLGIYGGLNLYLYANSNPITFSDPSGLKCTESSASIGIGGDILLGPVKKLLKKLGRKSSGGVSLSAYASYKTCEACCEDTGVMGESEENELGGQFGISAEVNVLPPIIKGVSGFAKKYLNIKIKIFFGLEFSFNGGGQSYFKKDACGNEQKEGCFSLFASFGIKGNISFLDLLDTGAKGSILVDTKFCLVDQTKKHWTFVVQDFEVNGEVKIWFSVEISYGFFQMSPIGKQVTYRGQSIGSSLVGKKFNIKK